MFPEIADRELLEVGKRLTRAERTKDIVILRDLIGDEYMGVGASGEVLTKEIVPTRFSDPSLEFEHHEVSDIRQWRIVASQLTPCHGDRRGT